MKKKSRYDKYTISTQGEPKFNKGETKAKKFWDILKESSTVKEYKEKGGLMPYFFRYAGKGFVIFTHTDTSEVETYDAIKTVRGYDGPAIEAKAHKFIDDLNKKYRQTTGANEDYLTLVVNECEVIFESKVVESEDPINQNEIDTERMDKG